MSTQLNTYVMRGVLLPFDTFAGIDRGIFEPYRDDAFKGVHHHNGLCVLFDGMNGNYVAIGRVIAKTADHQGFDLPVEASPDHTMLWDAEIHAALATMVILAGKGNFIKDHDLRTLVISHYR